MDALTNRISWSLLWHGQWSALRLLVTRDRFGLIREIAQQGMVGPLLAKNRRCPTDRLQIIR